MPPKEATRLLSKSSPLYINDPLLNFNALRAPNYNLGMISDAPGDTFDHVNQ